MNNNLNDNINNNFTDAPDKTTSNPVLLQTTPVNNQTPNHSTQKSKNHNATKTIALLICCCIVFSGAFGFGGMYLAWNYMNNNTTQSQQGGTHNSGTNNNSGESVIYQSANNNNTGTLVSNDAMANAISSAVNTVVEITTETMTTDTYFGQYVTKGAGSGVIITSDGYIITCAHVIDGATNVNVKLTDGKEYPAIIKGKDNQTDIAVIKIDVTNLPTAVIGDSSKLILGEIAIAIGNPLGELGGTVTDGIISALDREVKIDGQTYSLLQTNAAINPGNSGGGLFNINGELIGVVNAKSSGSGIEGLGFAVPINSAIKIADQLITNGYISGRPKLGITVSEVNSSTTSYALRASKYPNLLNFITDYGVYFIEYTENQSGDLEFGDRIVGIDGYTVSSYADVTSLLKKYNVGDKITITVSRLVDPSNARSTESKMIDMDLTLVEEMPIK